DGLCIIPGQNGSWKGRPTRLARPERTPPGPGGLHRACENAQATRENEIPAAEGDYPASSARIRAQLRAPLSNEVRSYFSLGECTRSSSSAKPTSSESMPSTSRNSP